MCYLIDFVDMRHTVYTFPKNTKLISEYFLKKYGFLKVNVNMSFLCTPKKETAIKFIQIVSFFKSEIPPYHATFQSYIS